MGHPRSRRLSHAFLHPVAAAMVAAHRHRGSTVIAAFAVALLTQAVVSGPKLELDLGLTSAVYGTLGTIYAVLIAFVVSGVWQSFSSAEMAVSSEANASDRPGIHPRPVIGRAKRQDSRTGEGLRAERR